MSGPELNAVNAAGAALPLFLILLLMVGRRWDGARAGAVGAASAAILAVGLFGADYPTLAAAVWKASILSFHVLYIIWPALILYHVVEAAGAIRSIGVGVASLTEDHILQLLILGFAFSSFLQGVAGFGVPVAVVAPLLIGLGFPPVQATAVPLIGHSWAVTMGDLASSFQALLAVTGLPGRELGLWTATFLGLSCVATGFSVAHLHAGFLPIHRCLGAILTLSLAMALTQWFFALFEYWILASFVAGMVGVGASLLLARLGRRNYPSLWGLFPTWPSPWGRRTPHRDVAAELRSSGMGFHLAFSAYYGLIVIVVLATLVPPLHRAFDASSLTFHFAATSTALGWTTEASSYKLAVLGHPGAFLIYATLLAYGIYRTSGHWRKASLARVLAESARRGLPTSLAVFFMVAMAMIMAHSGMTILLARGAIALTGAAYPLFSPFIGLLGCFMTGSNTNSNVLFGLLQRDIAVLMGKDPLILAALQTSGAALGSMVAPAKVLVACATAGLQGREGEVIRACMGYCLAMTLLLGLIGWALALWR